MSYCYDIAIIGAGVVGSAIARQTAKCDVKTVLIEASTDIGTGTSKSNTAILHTGFDASCGSLEAKLLRRSYNLMKEYAEEVGIPVEYRGAVLVAWDIEETRTWNQRSCIILFI